MEIERLTIKGEEITVTSTVLVCEKCLNEIFDEELDEANLNAAYSIYRERYHLLPPARIREIREKYGLSQRSLGRILEWER